MMKNKIHKTYTVYLSPSTQDKNIGVGKYGSEEMRMNQVADVVERELKRHGVGTYRNNPSWNVTQSVADSNGKNPDLHLSIHSNASTGKAKGCISFSHKLNNGDSHAFAKNLYEGITSISPWGGLGIKQGYNYYGEGKHLYETAYTKGVSSLVELDFHDHEEGAKFMMDHIEDLGVSLAKSCLKTLDIPWIDLHWAKKHLDRLVDKKIIDSPSLHKDLNVPVSKGELFALLDRITK